MGGIVATVHRLTIVSPSGTRTHVVLRRYEADWGSRFVEQEAQTLAVVRLTSARMPDLIASAPEGIDGDGHPALLMTHLGGRVDLSPRDPESYVRQMATVAAEIHGLDLVGIPFEPWMDPASLKVPTAATRPKVWRRMAKTLAASPPDTPMRFVHRDFQHFNLLWSRGRLTGVVDWTFASTAPPALDVGHCRLNLAALHGFEWAEHLRLAYEAEVGAPLDPGWDLHAVASYTDNWPAFIPVQVAGRVPVDTDGMTARVEALVASILDRIG